MQPYLAKVLKQFGVATPIKPQDSLHPHVPPRYGEKTQDAEQDTLPPVGKKHRSTLKQLQENSYGMPAHAVN